MIVLIKVSGELIGSSAFERFISQINELVSDGIKVAIVIGGGNIMRGADANVAVPKPVAHDVGMLATVINALILKASLVHTKNVMMCSKHIDGIADEFNRDVALDSLRDNKVLVLSGGIGVPFFSTDMASVLRSLQLGCDFTIKLTKVDGVYSDDPLKKPSAQFLEKVSYAYMIENQLKIFDRVALVLAQEHKMSVIISNMYKTSIKDIINGRGIYSLIT